MDNLGKELDKDLKKIVEAIELKEQCRGLHHSFTKGRCLDFAVPIKYKKDYGIDRTTLIASVLEAYHQLRLLDEKEQ